MYFNFDWPLFLLKWGFFFTYGGSELNLFLRFNFFFFLPKNVRWKKSYFFFLFSSITYKVFAKCFSRGGSNFYCFLKIIVHQFDLNVIISTLVNVYFFLTISTHLQPTFKFKICLLRISIIAIYYTWLISQGQKFKNRIPYSVVNWSKKT